MPPLGYALVLLGTVLARQVLVGRASNTVEDLGDLTTAFLNGDMAGVRDVMSRKGGGGVAGVVDSSSYPTFESGGSGSPLGLAVMQEAIKLGEKAKGYVWGAVGPTYYDCSGLIWRAMKNTGVYTGYRFTSGSFVEVMKMQTERVTSPAAGDIVVWPGKHIGVATGPDSYYSARSPSKGIGGASISGDAGYFGQSPQVYRITSKEKKY